MEKKKIKVSGMSCAHCVSSIEENVSNIKGVTEVKVDLNQGTVDVVYDKKIVTQDMIAEVIGEQGYDVIGSE